MLSRTMARHTIATPCRNTRLQVRNGSMTEGAITTMGDSDRRIRGSTGVMTACTGCPVDVLNTTDRYRPRRNMVCMSYRFI